jgi:hypothetical protein
MLYHKLHGQITIDVCYLLSKRNSFFLSKTLSGEFVNSRVLKFSSAGRPPLHLWRHDDSNGLTELSASHSRIDNIQSI